MPAQGHEKPLRAIVQFLLHIAQRHTNVLHSIEASVNIVTAFDPSPSENFRMSSEVWFLWTAAISLYGPKFISTSELLKFHVNVNLYSDSVATSARDPICLQLQFRLDWERLSCYQTSFAVFESSNTQYRIIVTIKILWWLNCFEIVFKSLLPQSWFLPASLRKSKGLAILLASLSISPS